MYTVLHVHVIKSNMYTGLHVHVLQCNQVKHVYCVACTFEIWHEYMYIYCLLGFTKLMLHVLF